MVFFFLLNSFFLIKNYWLELLREFFLVGFGTIQLHFYSVREKS